MESKNIKVKSRNELAREYAVGAKIFYSNLVITSTTNLCTTINLEVKIF